MRVTLAVTSLLFAGPPAWAQIDCSVPDALCTGDPCVIPTVEVADPCIVDFGARAVVVAGRLKVFPDGTLSLTAASITIDGRIRGRSVSAGPEITLIATAGDVSLNGPISSPQPVAFEASATVTLQASGNIVANAPIRVPGFFGSQTVTLEAGGDIVVGRGITWPYSLTLRAGGSIEIGAPVRAGILVAEADDLLVVDGIVRGRPFLRGASGVEVRRTLVSGGWPVEITSSGGGVTIDGRIIASLGYPSAGDVVITAAGAVAINQNVTASSTTASGQIAGTIRVVGGSVAVAPGVTLNADGGNDAGEIRLWATAGDLGLAGNFFARGGGGGIIEGTAAGNTTASGRFECGPGGCIGLSAGGTLDTSAGTFDEPVEPDCPGSPSAAFVDGPG